MNHHDRLRVRPLNAAKSFTVTVTATLGAGPDPIFTLDSKLKGPNGHLVFNKNNDGMKKLDFYLMEFDLVDQTHLGLQFEPNPMNAFWVALSETTTPPDCPQKATYCSQVYAISNDPNGRSLTVRNDDDNVQAFRFSLNFVDQGGKPHCFDPIGQNQNGGS